jgi:Raffinose synthase or seed imbibition protein Sip1
MILLAVAAADVLTVLKTNVHGELLMVGKNDSLESGRFVVVAALGTTFEDAKEAAMARAEEVVRRSQPSMPEIWNKAGGENGNINVQKLQGWYDGLTYCTWNALGQDLDQGKIHTALQVLSEHGVAVTNLLIDDNWQSLDYAGAS